MRNSVIDYTLYLADSALILGQRNGDWCGHGPILEQDIAITNITLDLVGQARSFYQYAATLIGGDTTEDSLAYLRVEREFKNCLLAERPNGDWGQTILRQFLFSSFQRELYTVLTNHTDQILAAIAEKSLKEVNYHVRWSSEWVIRLGDGTEESRSRILSAIASIWTFTGEMFMPESFETTSGIVVAELETSWKEKIKTSFAEANIDVPENTFMRSGGKKGIQSEHLGFILAEMQYLQRSYPGCEW